MLQQTVPDHGRLPAGTCAYLLGGERTHGHDSAVTTAITPYGVVGFVLAAAFAVTQRWSLPAFCWSTWLAGLIYAWACVGTAALQIALTARSNRAAYERRIPSLQHVPSTAFQLGVTALGVLVAYAAFRIYAFAFGFFGLFLSVFAEMEPVTLFGRDGFINSDFFTPVAYLVEHFWPMAAGVLITSWQDLLRGNPWKRVLLPLQQEALRMHVMVLALPFVSLAAWALLGAAYHSLAIVLLMGLFYLLARRPSAAGSPDGERHDARPVTAPSARS
ncbi:MAG: hypothetical protein OEZ42_15250 [Gemmatimonadota bacterium]|nr:hypothetical protein [Gemmatimonadota bacterium]